MWCWNGLYGILMLLMSMKSVETVTDTSFNIVKPGKSIMGKVGSQQPARSKIECSTMCLRDESCQGYQYKDKSAGLDKCILIHNDCEESFQNSSSAVTYKKVSDQINASNGSWTPPSTWNGPSAVLYQSFDSSDGFVLMEGNQATSDHVPLVPGKVNNAWTLARSKSQWVDLGIHTEACMTRPETCGAAGGAISMWMKVHECPNVAGTISSYNQNTGLLIFCPNDIRFLRFHVGLPSAHFYTDHSRPTEWTHIVLNYIGPNDGEGIRIFYDGQEVGNDTTQDTYLRSTGNGRIVVGRRRTDIDADYASMQIDELIYFDATLKSDDVQLIYNSTKC